MGAMTQTEGAHILVVDDEPAIQRALTTNLRRHGFRVETANTGAQALERFGARRPDVILLDLGLPDMEGLEIIREVRAGGSTPIIVLSVRGSERDKVAALDQGADDYLTKPFGVDELLARLRVALRHAARPASGTDAVLKAGDLEMDLEKRRVSIDGREVRLTRMEYELLRALMAHQNRVLTDRMLLQEVWGPEYGAEAHYLHVYVARLRRKIEQEPQRPRHLITEPGVGYRLVVDEDG
jgi:two-component system KDP operon response regulator KdpE